MAIYPVFYFLISLFLISFFNYYSEIFLFLYFVVHIAFYKNIIGFFNRSIRNVFYIENGKVPRFIYISLGILSVFLILLN